jgi:hypothetical protein
MDDFEITDEECNIVSDMLKKADKYLLLNEMVVTALKLAQINPTLNISEICKKSNKYWWNA